MSSAEVNKMIEDLTLKYLKGDLQVRGLGLLAAKIEEIARDAQIIAVETKTTPTRKHVKTVMRMQQI